MNEAIRPVARRQPPDTATVAAAKAWGKKHGYTGRPGGWIYNAKGRHIAHGWASFAQYLQSIGVRFQ